MRASGHYLPLDPGTVLRRAALRGLGHAVTFARVQFFPRAIRAPPGVDVSDTRAFLLYRTRDVGRRPGSGVEGLARGCTSAAGTQESQPMIRQPGPGAIARNRHARGEWPGLLGSGPGLPLPQLGGELPGRGVVAGGSDLGSAGRRCNALEAGRGREHLGSAAPAGLGRQGPHRGAGVINGGKKPRSDNFTLPAPSAMATV